LQIKSINTIRNFRKSFQEHLTHRRHSEVRCNIECEMYEQ